MTETPTSIPSNKLYDGETMETDEKLRDTARKIFSDDFCYWLRLNISMLSEEQKKLYLETAGRIHEASKGRSMNICILALSVFLPASIVSSGLDIDEILRPITEHNKNIGVEKYIQ